MLPKPMLGTETPEFTALKHLLHSSLKYPPDVHHIWYFIILLIH